MYHARPEVAEERFDQLVNFLEEHGETGIARQAQNVKESGGIREALHFITDKAAEGFSTTSCQEATPLILLTTIGIMQTLPPH